MTQAFGHDAEAVELHHAAVKMPERRGFVEQNVIDLRPIEPDAEVIGVDPFRLQREGKRESIMACGTRGIRDGTGSLGPTVCDQSGTFWSARRLPPLPRRQCQSRTQPALSFAMLSYAPDPELDAAQVASPELAGIARTRLETQGDWVER